VAITVISRVKDDVSEVRITFDSATSYTFNAAAARRLAYDLREAADVAERHQRTGWPASAGWLETAR
jgi:hypothetical protein